MTILLAPSEEKLISPNHCSIGEFCNFFAKDFSDLIFSFPEQKKLFLDYLDALKECPEEIFGTKNPTKILNSISTVLEPAIIRYTGVAFNAFDFSSLNTKEKAFAYEHIIIFSNLFGALLASDKIPFYKLKQGIKPPKFQYKLDKFFQTHQSKFIDEYLNKQNAKFIIDLRAKIYESFYDITIPKATFTILKNGKAMSHFSKHYRGLIARFCVQQFAAQPITDLKHFLDILQNNFDATGEFLDENLHITLNFKD